MDWIRTQVQTTGAGIEPLTALLLDNGVTGLQIDDPAEFRAVLASDDNWDYAEPSLLDEGGDDAVTAIFYLPAATGRDTLAAINARLPEVMEPHGGAAAVSAVVSDDGWEDEWRKYYKPFRVGVSLVIRPTWEEYEPREGDRVLTLEPGHAFGTGQHQSTRLCMEAIERWLRHGTDMADIGCGSGILAIAARLLGARSALGVDIDGRAVRTAEENAALNGLKGDNCAFITGNILTERESLEVVARKAYGLLAANIVADAIIPLAPIAYGLVDPGGMFVAGGIIRERLEEVTEALAAVGFEPPDISLDGEWACVAARKPEGKGAAYEV